MILTSLEIVAGLAVALLFIATLIWSIGDDDTDLL